MPALWCVLLLSFLCLTVYPRSLPPERQRKTHSHDWEITILHEHFRISCSVLHRRAPLRFRQSLACKPVMELTWTRLEAEWALPSDPSRSPAVGVCTAFLGSASQHADISGFQCPDVQGPRRQLNSKCTHNTLLQYMSTAPFGLQTTCIQELQLWFTSYASE